MSNKEIKNILKLAKEAIKNKDTKTAIFKCNEALKLDRKNYLAYVLLVRIKDFF